MRLDLAYPESIVPWLLLANLVFSCLFWSSIVGLIALGASL